MPLHVPFGKQETVDSESNNVSCWEMILSKFNFRNTHISRDIEQSRQTDEEEEEVKISEIVIRNTREGEPDHHLGLRLLSSASLNQVVSMTAYRHVLEYIDINSYGPGKEMKIQNGDEMLKLNNTFVPVMTHGEVMRLLYDLKVDGQSTFEMMIRRKKKSEKWKWVEIFAILAPSKCFDKDTVVQRPEFVRVKNNQTDIVTEHVYKVPGTQLYMQIDNTGLRADTMSGDNTDVTKVIENRTFVCQDGEGLSFMVTLSDKTLRRYITFCPLNREIILSERPQRFMFSQLDNGTHFIRNGYCLGYDHESDKVRPMADKFAFDEYPVPGYLA